MQQALHTTQRVVHVFGHSGFKLKGQKTIIIFSRRISGLYLYKTYSFLWHCRDPCKHCWQCKVIPPMPRLFCSSLQPYSEVVNQLWYRNTDAFLASPWKIFQGRSWLLKGVQATHLVHIYYKWLPILSSSLHYGCRNVELLWELCVSIGGHVQLAMILIAAVAVKIGFRQASE